MSRRKLLLFVVAIGCTGEPKPDPGVPPSTDPLPPWGVPMTGGTMLVTRDGRHAVVADPDRDRVVTVDLATATVAAEIALTAGDEPGRLVEDGAGRLHVALRRGGALLTIPDPTSASGVTRRAACSEPRGVAYDAVTDQLHVACTSGELVSFAAAGGEPTRRIRIDGDLRDVVVAGDRLIVSRFRTAEVLTLDATGAIVDRRVPPTVQRLPNFGGVPLPIDPTTGMPRGVDAVPAVAWRTVAMPDGGVIMTHQRQTKSQLGTSMGGYGGSCSHLAESAITVLPPDGAPIAVSPIVADALPIDLAISATGNNLAIVAAGADHVYLAGANRLSVVDHETCPIPPEITPIDDGLGAPSSVAFANGDDLVIYYPEPAAIVVHPAALAGRTIIQLPGALGHDAGRAMFHRQTVAGLACASCHPEGRDDGLVWDFETIGLRRTQSVAGHILARAPYHWSADIANLDQLMDVVFTTRMAGGNVSHSERLALGPWLDRIPAPVAAPPSDPTAAARGKTLFESADLACTSCHAGPLLTTNQRFNVNTGGSFKVPSLVGVGARAPYLHDGCAITLADRFGPCGGGDAHGHTSALSEVQLADLIVYLESR